MHKYDNLTNLVGDPNAIIYVRNLDGTYVWVNKQFENTIDTRLINIVGKTNKELFGEEQSSQWETIDEIAKQTNEPVVTQEYLYDVPSKSTRKFASIKTVFKDYDGKYRLLGISVEILSELGANLEQLIARLRAKMIAMNLRDE